jgi:hypothetical protein
MSEVRFAVGDVGLAERRTPGYPYGHDDIRRRS